MKVWSPGLEHIWSVFKRLHLYGLSLSTQSSGEKIKEKSQKVQEKQKIYQTDIPLGYTAGPGCSKAG